jgi:hypothetical protein
MFPAQLEIGSEVGHSAKYPGQLHVGSLNWHCGTITHPLDVVDEPEELELELEEVAPEDELDDVANEHIGALNPHWTVEPINLQHCNVEPEHINNGSDDGHVGTAELQQTGVPLTQNPHALEPLLDEELLEDEELLDIAIPPELEEDELEELLDEDELEVGQVGPPPKPHWTTEPINLQHIKVLPAHCCIGSVIGQVGVAMLQHVGFPETQNAHPLEEDELLDEEDELDEDELLDDEELLLLDELDVQKGWAPPHCRILPTNIQHSRTLPAQFWIGLDEGHCGEFPLQHAGMLPPIQNAQPLEDEELLDDEEELLDDEEPPDEDELDDEELLLELEEELLEELLDVAAKQGITVIIDAVLSSPELKEALTVTGCWSVLLHVEVLK